MLVYQRVPLVFPRFSWPFPHALDHPSEASGGARKGTGSRPLRCRVAAHLLGTVRAISMTVLWGDSMIQADDILSSLSCG